VNGITFTLPDNTQIYLEVEEIKDGQVKLSKKNVYVQSENVQEVIQKIQEDAKIEFKETVKEEVTLDKVDLAVITAKIR
jgi:uncharacterized protein YlzI (FlbEa/FlbD family)